MIDRKTNFATVTRVLAVGWVILLGVTDAARAQTAGVFDWAALGLADEAAVPSPVAQTSGGVTTTISHSTVVSGGTFTPAGGGDFVSYETGASGTVTQLAQLGFNNNARDPNDRVIVDIAFSEGVTSLTFTITDVDQATWDDFIVVEIDAGAGFVNARNGDFASLGGAGVSEDDEAFAQGWEGSANVGNGSIAANINFDFGSTVIDAVRISYFSGDDGTSADPPGQLSGISDLAFTTVPNAIDLELTKSIDSQFPNVGDTVTYTLDLENDGFIPATGVVVTDVLPSGVLYSADNGNGAYNPSTGLWTLPAPLAVGATTSLQISGTVNPSGSRSNFADVTAANEADIDSTPGNGATNPSEDDSAAIAFSISGGGPGIPPTLSCAAAPGLFDWDVNSWANGDQANSYTANGQPVSFAFSGDTARFIDVGIGQSPLRSNLLEGGITPAQQSLLYVTNFQSSAEQVTLTGNIGAPGVGVSELQFTIFDVDIGAAFIDELRVSGFLNGALVAPLLTAGAANAVSGAVATGIAESDSPSADGNLVITFTSPVDRFVVTYGSAPNAPSDPAQQGVALHDLSFCQPLTPDLVAAKTTAVFDPSGAGLLAAPGNDVTYTIRVTNTGDGVVDQDSIFLVDRLPPEIEFYNDEFTTGAGGVIDFVQSGSGLTFNEGTDLGFSNSPAPPSSFVECGFNAATGYDPRITFVCFNPKGAFQTGNPDPFIEFTFRARVK